MSQERLSALAMFSIENTRAKKLNVSNIFELIEVFAELEAKRNDTKQGCNRFFRFLVLFRFF